jgi:hypothetical protein
MKRPQVRALPAAELVRSLLQSAASTLDTIEDPSTEAYEMEMNLMDLGLDVLRLTYGNSIDAYIRHLENTKD